MRQARGEQMRGGFSSLAAPETALRSVLVSRRAALRTVAAVAGAMAVAPTIAAAQPAPPPPGGAGPATPPSTTTSPPRDFTQPSVYFSDPDVLTVDSTFSGFQGNSSIMRLWNGPVNGKPILWAEGPAWNSQGKFLLWSDIPNNRQLRWLDDDGHVTVFREPSGQSNGNTMDYSGRQISFEHLNRRVVRYEHDGAISILAEAWEGKRLN